MENWFSKLGKKIETAVSNAYPVGTTYYGGMSGAGNMNLSKIEHAANQMDPEEAKEFKKETNTALGVGTAAAVTLPFIANGIQAFRAAHPIISGVIDTGLTIDGVRNALSDNGVKKTINYAQDGNWGRAAASGTIDALDLLGGVGFIGDVTRYSKKAFNRFLESLVRIGDDFAPMPVSSAMTQLFGNQAKGLRYTLFNNPELVYQLPYNYSGQKVLNTVDPHNTSPAHKGDLIDVLFGKSGELVDLNGNILAKMSTDISNVPEKTIQAFQTIPGQSNKLPKVLKFIQGEGSPIHVYKPIQSTGDLVKGVPQEIARANVGEVEFTKIPFLSQSGIDPGHFGITAIKNSNRVNFFGHDVYHFSPGLYAKTHDPSKLIPKINITVGQPFIAEWQIPKVESPLNLDVKIPTAIVEGVSYKAPWYQLMHHKPFEFTYYDLFQPQQSTSRFKLNRSSIFHKSGGSIKIKKKNRGKFTASAKAAGHGVQEHAHKVMNDPNATPLQKKRANFAIQAKKWHRKHQLGGKLNYLNYFQ